MGLPVEPGLMRELGGVKSGLSWFPKRWSFWEPGKACASSCSFEAPCRPNWRNSIEGGLLRRSLTLAVGEIFVGPRSKQSCGFSSTFGEGLDSDAGAESRKGSLSLLVTTSSLATAAGADRRRLCCNVAARRSKPLTRPREGGAGGGISSKPSSTLSPTLLPNNFAPTTCHPIISLWCRSGCSF